MTGRVLAINTGSTSTKIGFFIDGKIVFDQNLVHSVSDLAKYDSVMDQDLMRRDAITEFLAEKGVALADIDIVMSRAGLITPVETGVYEVNEAMRKALVEGRNGVHACNLSGLIAHEIALEINEARRSLGISGICKAYVADAAMADEMLPEAKVGGLPEFPRRALCHALNSRAMVRRYAKERGLDYRALTVIVAHMGGGTSVTLHKDGKIIDTNDALGGDGPISAERAGTVPAFPLVEMCFSGKYSKEEIKGRLVGKGGAVAWFGTNDFREIAARAAGGDSSCRTFISGYCLSVAKYVAALAADVCGKADAIILTGGIANNRDMMADIESRVSFIAPVAVYPGENELVSLADNGYMVLSGEVETKTYFGNSGD